MSLITDNLRQQLYNEAVSNYEHASLSFWTYIFKVYFSETYFFYDREKPASEQADPLRRVDGQVKYFEEGSFRTRVLCFHEAKKTYASDDDMRVVEGQAFEACATYCGNSNLTHVFAITTIGTRARTWKYIANQLQPLSGSSGLLNRGAYIDANSTAASQISDSFNHMKQFPPSQIAGTGNSNIAVTSPMSLGYTVPSTSASTSQSSEFTAAQMDGNWHFSNSDAKYYRYDSGKKDWEFAT
ncbi:hypothetical protein AOQ84DRAFT_341143 [Glonium stellatum]|uniref:Uncharacterized protein n=1 Tax=Glonium stellatum TaxID=574774 RepID=A0A8E2F0A9_9PEZI|nr:hypothetical protein AOQ84DRAFT_341143 [Glonium stellatum]